MAGLGVALVAHAALLWALGLGAEPSEPAAGEPMEVSFVEEFGPVSGTPATEPSAQSVAPEFGPVDEAAPLPAEQPIPEPAPREPPQPAPSQQRAALDARANTPAPARGQSRQQAQPARQPGAGSAEANRGSRLGPELVKGLGSDPAARSEAPSGATMTAQARADITSLIARQVQPCANRQRYPGPGAERIRVTIRLQLNRNGSLASQPTIVAREGVDEGNRRYLSLVEENTINTFSQCSPLRGLPAELYDVPRGWRDFRLRYRLPG